MLNGPTDLSFTASQGLQAFDQACYKLSVHTGYTAHEQLTSLTCKTV